VKKLALEENILLYYNYKLKALQPLKALNNRHGAAADSWRRLGSGGKGENMKAAGGEKI